MSNPLQVNCENEGEEDDIYKIYSQFKELSINVINNDKGIELLQIVKDLDIRAQIINKISNTFTSQNHITEDVHTKEGSYTKTEVKNLLLEKRKLISSPTTISDLKQEINNLKDGIYHLKEKNVTILTRLDNIESLKDLGNISESFSYEEDIPFINDIFLLTFWDNKKIIRTWNEKPFTLEFITKPFTKIINELSSKIVLKNNQNHFSIYIYGDHPNDFWNRKKHVVSLSYENNFTKNNIPTKARPCRINSNYLELCKKEIDSLLQKGLIRHSKSLWSYTTFYVNKHAEQERGAPTMRPSRPPPSRSNILAQVGNQKLIAANIASTSGLNTDHPMYNEFLDFMQSKQGKDNIPQFSQMKRT
ncbi:hypothetical protein H5410_050696 [Solanum commersonii]|uniref:Uncharacterized protein n=1 Tax=Solanum commersonii TaxID=4109 RepID=A0A9J5WXS9_SOLCO|nr:hypothetical protein H5410_050696 [Solanum commersonii]